MEYVCSRKQNYNDKCIIETIFLGLMSWLQKMISPQPVIRIFATRIWNVPEIVLLQPLRSTNSSGRYSPSSHNNLIQSYSFLASTVLKTIYISQTIKSHFRHYWIKCGQKEQCHKDTLPATGKVNIFGCDSPRSPNVSLSVCVSVLKL